MLGADILFFREHLMFALLLIIASMSQFLKKKKNYRAKAYVDELQVSVSRASFPLRLICSL